MATGAPLIPQKWWVQRASNRIIGTGIPISQSRMERMRSAFFLPAPMRQWHDSKKGSASSIGKSSRRRFRIMVSSADHRGTKHD
jgi:hypothetical protein